jgi:hypothetical protein
MWVTKWRNVSIFERERSTKERARFVWENNVPNIHSKTVTPWRFFTEINQLNLSLQGNMMNIFTAHDEVSSCCSKFLLYWHRVEAGDIPMWLELTTLLEATKQKCSFADVIIRHLLSVTESISGCFPDLEQHDMNAWLMSPFTMEEKVIKDNDVKQKENFMVWEKITHWNHIFRILIWQLFGEQLV